jgi:hypothetical protein
MEEWKEITDYPNYEISNLGNVKNKKTNKILKSQINLHGYYQIRLFKNKKVKTFTLHKLLSIIFIPNPNNFLEIDHKDKNALNNSLDNLRWVSHSQNNYNRNMKTQNSTSKFRGVSWDKKIKKWRVAIYLNQKKTFLGYFEIEEEGAKAFNEFVISHNLQEFVDLNII